MKNLTRNVLIVMLAVILAFSGMAIAAYTSNAAGDANGDGKVNSTDALLILQHSVGLRVTNLDKTAADVNKDGSINSTDALTVLQISVGLVKISSTKSTTTTKKTTTTTTTKKSTTTTTTTKKTTTTTQGPQLTSNFKAVSTSYATKGIGTIQKFWMAKTSTSTVEIQKVAYGSKITQTFKKANADPGMDVDSKTVTYQPLCDIAIINCSPTEFKMGVSQSLMGKKASNITPMARKVGALIAINCGPVGEYPGSLSKVRNGSLYLSKSGTSSRVLQMYKNGTWKRGTVNSSNDKSLINQGLYNTIRYQCAIIWDGKITNDYSDTYYHNRTVIAQISSNKYLIAVGEFMPVANLAKLLQSYGVKYAVIPNGGNCSFMYARGVGNVTSTKATQLKDLDKVNTVETEFFANNGMLGKNSSGQKKLGGPCEEPDLVYCK